MTSINGSNSYSNKSWYDYTGITEGDWTSAFHPDDLQRTWDNWNRCLETGEGMEIECRIRRASDGMYRWHLGKTLPYRDSSGKIVKWIGVSTDIHDQKIVAEKTSQNEAFLKEAQEIAHIGSWELNLDSYKVLWSDELYRIFGYEPGKMELTYQAFLSHIYPEDLQKILDSNVIIKANRKPLKVTYRIIRPDGRIRYISASLKAIIDGDDNMIVIRGTCQDVTELKESQRFIQEISNASPGIIAVYDLNLKSIIYANREINIALGYSNEEKSKMNSSAFEKIIHPDDQPMFFRFLDWSLNFNDEETGELECRIRNAGGEWIWFRIRMKVFKRDINEKVFQIIAIAQDVTYRRKLEGEAISQKLSKHKEILNAILHAQEGERERIGEALHNGLGQLLYAVKLNLETYIAKSGVDQKRDKLLMNDITSMLVEAIDETRKISFELMPGILKDFGLEISLKELGKKICKNFNVKWNISGLNDRLEDYLEIAIFRIIQELMNNIVKHAKVNEAKIELVKNGSMINILVQDNGVGFDMQELGSIRKGTGLQSIRNRAKLLNGKIDIVSEPGKGTAIFIEIDESMKGGNRE
jgi:two-component system, NarL family, sensor kinase